MITNLPNTSINIANASTTDTLPKHTYKMDLENAHDRLENQ